MRKIWDELVQREFIKLVIDNEAYHWSAEELFCCHPFDTPEQVMREVGLLDMPPAVHEFLNTPFRAETILNFLGFYATAWLADRAVTFEDVLARFNERAWHFFCQEVTETQIKSFLEVYNFEDTGRREFLAAWAILKGQCSIWHKRNLDEIMVLSDEKALTEMPEHVRIPAKFAGWILDGVKKN